MANNSSGVIVNGSIVNDGTSSSQYSYSVALGTNATAINAGLYRQLFK